MTQGRALAVGGVVAALALGGGAGPRASAAARGGGARAITGTATGTVEGVPDTLTVTLGVESHGQSAQAALAQNADRATRVIAALKAAGVAPEDLQTSQLSLSPTLDRQGRVNGYSVSNMVTA